MISDAYQFYISSVKKNAIAKNEMSAHDHKFGLDAQEKMVSKFLSYEWDES